jgi:hypothetical protein
VIIKLRKEEDDAYYGNYAFINITITILIVLVNLQYHDYFSLSSCDD